MRLLRVWWECGRGWLLRAGLLLTLPPDGLQQRRHLLLPQFSLARYLPLRGLLTTPSVPHIEASPQLLPLVMKGSHRQKSACKTQKQRIYVFVRLGHWSDKESVCHPNYTNVSAKLSSVTRRHMFVKVTHCHWIH